jgi:cell wall-associated NlpC family hydrolase
MSDVEGSYTGCPRLPKLATAVATLALILTTNPTTGYADPPGDAESRLNAASDRLEKLVERYNATRADLATTRARVRAVARQLRPLDARLDAAQSRVSRIAVTAYKDGRLNTANVLLKAQSPDMLVDQLLVLDRLARTKHRDLRDLDALGNRLRARQDALVQLANRQAAQRRALGDAKAKVLAEIAQLERSRARVTASRSVRAWGAPVAPLAVDSRSVQERALSGPRARSALSFALDQRGKMYQFAASGPYTYDCSGLAMAAWRRAGIMLPHNAYRMYWSVPHIQRSELRPGDLVFYYSDIHHVAVYVGGNRVIHAPGWGQPVTISPLHHAPVYGYGRPG